MTFTVALSAASGKTVTVDYATANDTAVAGSDYIATSGTLTFAPGEISKTITVQVKGDITDELDETFLVNLSGETNVTIADGQGIGSITDNDPIPTISVGDTMVIERDGPDEPSRAGFTVSLSHPSSWPVTIAFTTTSALTGTATPISDYGPRNNVPVIFPAGTTTQLIEVEVWGDNTPETSETFFVDISLTSPYAIIVDGRGECTIIDNDTPLPTGLQIGAPDNIRFSLSASSEPLIIDLRTDAIVATGSSDPLDYELIYYEYEYPSASAQIHMDWVRLEISANWVNWFTIFYWGDSDPNNNGMLGATYPVETDNLLIPFTNLYNGSTAGIAIDIDPHVPPGAYRYLRITTPSGGDNDSAQIDAIELLP